MQRFIIRFSIMVQAIFFDIDGTLVSFRTHEIPQSTRKALKELRNKGIKLFIATGRPETLMREAIGDLEFDGFIILNGAHCFTADHRLIHKTQIPADDIERLIKYYHEHPENPFVFVHDDQWFITHINEAVNQVTELIQIELPPVYPVEHARGKEIIQMMGYFGKEADEEIFGKVLLHCEPMRWNPLFTDIIRAEPARARASIMYWNIFTFLLKTHWPSATAETTYRCWSMPESEWPWEMQLLRYRLLPTM